MIYNVLENNYPHLIHSPGLDKYNPSWKCLKQLCSVFPVNNSTIEDIDIITFNNSSTGKEMSLYGKNLGLFEQSAKICNIPIQVLGKGMYPWIGINKIKLAYEVACKSSKNYILACDSSDVMFCNKIQGITNKFEKKKCKLLLNAERYFFPTDNQSLIDSYNFQKRLHPDCFSNSGIWIANRKYFIELVNDKLKNTQFTCDQTFFHYWYQKLYPDIQIDTHSEIFMVLNRYKLNDLKFIKIFI